eukprot:5823873-Prorocentrum_lima.AAC.1
MGRVEETIGHAASFWSTRIVQQAEVVTPIGDLQWVWDIDQNRWKHTQLLGCEVVALATPQRRVQPSPA